MSIFKSIICWLFSVVDLVIFGLVFLVFSLVIYFEFFYFVRDNLMEFGWVWVVSVFLVLDFVSFSVFRFSVGVW